MRITTTYKKHYVRFNAKYYCQCGYKFYRQNSDWFTMSEFNKKSYDECRKMFLEKIRKKERKCLKCGNISVPIL